MYRGGRSSMELDDGGASSSLAAFAVDSPKIQLIRIPPFHYLHVTDSNKNVTRVVEGPQSFTCMDHEVVVLGPVEMVQIPPRHFCVVSNPILRGKTGDVLTDAHGQARLRHGDQEVRLHDNYPDPFPLYPGEELTPTNMIPLQLVPENSALRLQATRDFVDHGVPESSATHVARRAGEEWLFRGPATYYPQVEVRIVDMISAVVLKPNQALHLEARNQCRDRQGMERKAGEAWLVRMEGAYLPDVEEKVIGVVNAVALTDRIALHLKAIKNFVDVYGIARKTGDEWLVRNTNSETHIPDVYERVIGQVGLVSLTAQQYCVIVNPVDPETLRNRIGTRETRRGPQYFFLEPGEEILDNAIHDTYILGAEESLQLTCNAAFVDEGGVNRRPGDRWFVYGPGDFVPSHQVQVLARKRAVLSMESLGIHWWHWYTTAQYQ